jgi:hypothetical protein
VPVPFFGNVIDASGSVIPPAAATPGSRAASATFDALIPKYGEPRLLLDPPGATSVGCAPGGGASCEKARNSLVWAHCGPRWVPARTVSRTGWVLGSDTSETIGPKTDHRLSVTVRFVALDSARMCSGATSSTRRWPCATVPSSSISRPGT